jgi:alanyl-tRNA synthetase
MLVQIEEVQQVEMLVNQWIQEEHPLEIKELPIAEAKAAG